MYVSKCAVTGKRVVLGIVAQVNSHVACNYGFLCVQIHAQVVVYLCILDNDQRSQMNLSMITFSCTMQLVNRYMTEFL